MEPARDARPSGSEWKLLTVTVIVSVLMLFLLARLRFPHDGGSPAAPQPAALPLERLAARATYDELAAILRRVAREATEGVTPIRVSRAVGDGPGHRWTLVPALRLSADAAIALLPSGPATDLDVPSAERLVAWNKGSGMALFSVAGTPGSVPRVATPDAVGTGPGYLAVVEVMPQGPAVRPLYFGRADRVQDLRWSSSILRLSGIQQTIAGNAAVFTLGGELVGLGLPADAGVLVIPAALLQEEAERLARGGSLRAADLGLEVQALDGPLRSVTGARDGVIVTHVRAGGPSDKQLAVADVIVSIGGVSIDSPDAYAAAMTRLTPGAPVVVDRVRGGTRASVILTPVPRTPEDLADGADLGLQLRTLPGTGARVESVAPRSAAASAGLRDGDVITAVAAVDAPSGAAVVRAYRQAPAGARLLVRVTRDGAHRLIVLTKP